MRTARTIRTDRKKYLLNMKKTYKRSLVPGAEGPSPPPIWYEKTFHLKLSNSEIHYTA